MSARFVESRKKRKVQVENEGRLELTEKRRRSRLAMAAWRL
jgi:hypothetical protein